MIQKIILFVVLLWAGNASAGVFGPSNLPECILKEMPGTEHNHEAQDIYWACQRRFGIRPVAKKNPWFGVKSRSQCIAKYGRRTESKIATDDIRQACTTLYYFP